MTLSVLDSVAELLLPAKESEVRHASTWLDSACRERGVPPEQINRLDICLNEALANIIFHTGGACLSPNIRLHLDVQLGQSINEASITISDTCPPFDPLAVVLKPRSQTLAEVEPGGLGLTLIRTYSDKLSYRYNEGCNQLKFSTRWIEGR